MVSYHLEAGHYRSMYVCKVCKRCVSSVAAVVLVVFVRRVAVVELRSLLVLSVGCRQLNVAELADSHRFGRLTREEVAFFGAGPAHDEAALPAVVAAADGGELHFLAAHAYGRLFVGNPDGRVVAARGFTALLKQVAHALPDVVHPFGLLCGRCSENTERLRRGFDEPAVP